MDELGNIGGLERTGQGGASYSGYYAPFRQKPSKKQEPQKLKQGEIVVGTVIEIIDKETAKIKLPMGTFSAVLHNKLIAGDTLFLLVAETTPSLVLRVHSITSFSGGKRRETKDAIRMLDVPDSIYLDDVIDYLIEKKSQILRSDVISFTGALEKIGLEEKKLDKQAVFKAIFMLIISANQPETLVESFYPAFLPNASILQILQSIANETPDAELLHFNETLANTLSDSHAQAKNLITAVCAYNSFAIANSQPIILLFAISLQKKVMLCRCEVFTEKKDNYLQNNALQVSLHFHSIIKKVMLSEEAKLIISKGISEIDKEKALLLKNLSVELIKFSSVVSHFSIIDESENEKVLIDELLKATPRNFSVVI